MKKSLKVIASAAMAFSMFASVAMADDAATTTSTTSTSATATAAAKTSADFKDLANVDAGLKAKIDAMLKADVFEGVSADSFGIDQNMTRAQAAKVLTLIYNIKVDMSVKTSSFSDVKGDDAANGWAIPYIEAAKKAGLIDGVTDTTFVPGDNVTLGQFAKLLVVGLGKKVDVTGDPWYKDAVTQAVALKLLPDGTDGGKAATRANLVFGAFGGQDAYAKMNAPATLNISDLKATGAKALTVTFNGVVDASKVTLSVNKGAATVALASTDGTKWSDDKKSVVLTTDSKLTAGTYTVKVAAAAKDNGVTIGDKASADVTVTDETISKVEIQTSSDTVAKFASNTIKFQATNQYGEVSDLPATRFQVVLNQGSYTASGDNQSVTLNTYSLAKDSKVAITIIAPNATAQATKILTVGDAPSASKVEIGDVTLASGKDRLTAGDSATIGLTVYDQYGNKIDDQATIQGSTTLISTNTSVIANSGLSINSDKKLAVTTLGTVTTDTDVTLTVVANGSGQSVSKTVKVYAPKAAYDVSFGSFTDTVAKGDGTVYLPLVVKDQFGATLSADDIVAAYTANKLTVYGSNAGVITNVAIETTAGDNKGKVKFDTSSNTGSATINVLVNTSGKSASFSVAVQDARLPQTIVVQSEPAGKILPGANTSLKFDVKDQYGKNIGNDFYDVSSATYGYKVNLSFSKVSGDDNGVAFNNVGDFSKVYTDISNDGLTNTFTANGGYGVYKLTAKLQKADGTTLSTVSRNVETVKADAADSLTYDVTAVGSIYKSPISSGNSLEAKKVTVSAKDSAGVTVALPATVVQGVYSSDTSIASVYQSGNDFYVQGANVNKGDVTLTVTYAPAAGNVKIATQKVTVSDVAPAADTVTVANPTKSILASALTGKYVYDGALAGDVKIKDTYGIEIKNADLVTYATHTQVQYIISNVKWSTGGAGSLTVNPTSGLISYSATAGQVTSFTITVVSLTNGKTASSNITVN